MSEGREQKDPDLRRLVGCSEESSLSTMTTSENVRIQGFRNNIQSEDNPDGALCWYCSPDSWEIDPNRREGRGGSWVIDENSLIIVPPAKKDFWRKTYYDPILIKDDGPILYAELDASKFFTAETSFVLNAARQFDQAGIVVRLGPDHWLKTGIEVVDQKPRLSCVVTNVYSDWSTQEWSDIDHNPEAPATVTTRCQMRVHCRGTNFVVQAKMKGGAWEFIRIAHLSRSMTCPMDPLLDAPQWRGPSPPENRMWVGIFAACPEDQLGGHAEFLDFIVREGSHFEHNADGNQDGQTTA